MASMIPRGPSRTAAMVAAFRSRATQSGQGLCNDPWADALAGELGRELMTEFESLLPSMELLVAVRTAVFDDEVRHWIGGTEARVFPELRTLGRPIRQVVVVGAGLDSRAARLGRPGLRFYEIDHPDSLEYKKKCVREIRGYTGDAITYVPCDLEQHDPVEPLATTDFQCQEPAVFLCEGLVPYLSAAAVQQMLSGIAAKSADSSIIVLDHGIAISGAGVSSSPEEQLLAQKFTSLGEPLRFGKRSVFPLLQRAGFEYTRSICLEDARKLLTGESNTVTTLRFQQVTVASRRRLERR